MKLTTTVENFRSKATPSDGPNQLLLGRLEKLLTKLKQIHQVVNDK